MKLSIATDAISADFETSVLLGLEWGIEHFELKRIHHKRVPDITNEEVRIIRNVLRAHSVSLSTLSPGLFKIPLDRALIEIELGVKLDKTVELANKLETRSIIVFGFERDKSRTEAEAIREIIEVFGQLAARAELEGITVFLENDRNLWGESPAAVRQIISGVNSPALRLNWDPGNLVGAFPEAPYPTSFEVIRDLVGHVHVKDAKATKEGFTHAMMGSGDVDWVGQFERLLRDGYSGYCVIEPHFGERIASSREHILATRKCLRLAERRLRGISS